MGITVIALSAYCGFILAPPDVDFIEDVGEEFQEFVEVVVSTGGLPDDPDDDDDETNNGSDDYTVTEIIQDVTTAGTSVLNEYTTYVGQALKGSMEFYDPRIFGGFAGTLPAFTLFLLWMFKNGYLDRTVDVPVTTGWTYYGDYYLPSFPEFDEYPYMYLRNTWDGKYWEIRYTDFPVYDASTGSNFIYKSKSSGNGFFRRILASDVESWGETDSISGEIPSYPNLYSSGDIVDSNSPILWANYDIYSYADGTSLCFSGSEPSSTTKEIERVEPDVVVYNSIAEALLAGGITAAEISIPQKVDLEKIFAGAVAGGLPAVQNQLLQNAQQITTESALKDYQDSITYQDPSTDPVDPDPPSPSDPGSDPSDPSDPTSEENRDINDFKLDLTGFFPFCIPFDIYEFLTLLAADPVAPVFTWEIAVPQLGQTFEIEIDLTPWDEVAALFRKLELLAFIVGLAYVTREKYIRG